MTGHAVMAVVLEVRGQIDDLLFVRGQRAFRKEIPQCRVARKQLRRLRHVGLQVRHEAEGLFCVFQARFEAAGAVSIVYELKVLIVCSSGLTVSK